ncbi:T9SS type A sorting domain-containing protein [Anaerophaga thermohalophila]|uniref:T9SS type A sorting domain-containing protein n=1 Tax=Anaerophaga thermohalophila TaxID=177400 RepID=UPI00031A18E1|nr:T9SS type A sorting domain-containing protein [Anaerophaga thermohalophila]
MKKQLLILSALALILNANLKAQNVVLNGDFSNGGESWTTWIPDWESWVTFNVTYQDGWANFTDLNVGAVQYWYLQFNQNFTVEQIASLEEGADYTLTFTAKAEGIKQLKVFFGEDGGSYTDLLPENVAGVGHIENLTTSAQTFSIPFVMTSTFPAMKLGFEGGWENIGFSISNVSLIKDVTNDIVNIDDSSVSSVFPNPADELVTITLNGNAAAVSVVDLSGKVVFAVSDVAGIDDLPVEVSAWNKGVYMVMVELLDGSKEVKKLMVR